MMEGDRDAKREFILSELARLIRGEAWFWMYRTCNARGEYRPDRFLHRHLSELQIALLRGRRLSPVSTGDGPDLSPASVELGLGSSLAFHHNEPDHFASTIGIFRKAGGPPFSEREIRDAHLLLTEVPWLHHREAPVAPARFAKDLSPRLAAIMELLLKGYHRKRIADELNISVQTIHGYIKEIYVHFKVNSQPALLQLLLHHHGRLSSP